MLAQNPDAIGRQQAFANYGTNGGMALSRSSTIPVRSDTVLLDSMSYGSSGNLQQQTDPAEIVTRFVYDAARRVIKVIENVRASSSSSSSSSCGGMCDASDDAKVVTQFTYTADGLRATVVAQNSRTGDQTTTYTYGTTLTESSVATSNLLRYVDYPDSVSGSDQIALNHGLDCDRGQLELRLLSKKQPRDCIQRPPELQHRAWRGGK